MKTITLTYDEAKAELDRLAAERPDYVYRSPVEPGTCVYFDPATKVPSCIVGHVLAAKGLTRDDLLLTAPEEQQRLRDARGYDEDDVEEATYDLNVWNRPTQLAAVGLFDADERTRALLSTAQRYQDFGRCWALAVSDAEIETARQYPKES